MNLNRFHLNFDLLKKNRDGLNPNVLIRKKGKE